MLTYAAYLLRQRPPPRQAYVAVFFVPVNVNKPGGDTGWRVGVASGRIGELPRERIIVGKPPFRSYAEAERYAKAAVVSLARRYNLEWRIQRRQAIPTRWTDFTDKTKNSRLKDPVLATLYTAAVDHAPVWFTVVAGANRNMPGELKRTGDVLKALLSNVTRKTTP